MNIQYIPEISVVKKSMFLFLLALTMLSTPDASAVSAPGEGSAQPLSAIEAMLDNGEVEKAIHSLNSLNETLSAGGDASRRAEVLLLLGQAYRLSGKNPTAVSRLEESLRLARESGNKSIQAKALNTLGSMYIGVVVPDLDNSAMNPKVRSARPAAKDSGLQLLNDAAKLAKEVGEPVLQASILNNLGNLYAGRRKLDAAKTRYSEGLSLLDGEGNQRLRAAISANIASVLLDAEAFADAEQYANRSSRLLAGMHSGSEKMNSLIRLGRLYRALSLNLTDKKKELTELSRSSFRSAHAVAVEIGSVTGKSYSLGYEGQLHEDAREFDKALDLTRRALFLAQSVASNDLLSLWQWQTGRIHAITGNDEAALIAYRRSLHALQQVKQAAPSGCAGCGLSFRDRIEPVYMGYLNLLFNQSTRSQDEKTAIKRLEEIRDTIESFRTAELQDYFKDSCIEARQAFDRQKDALSTNTAVIYFILLQNRLEILAQLPSGMKRFTVEQPKDAIVQEALAFRANLTRANRDFYLKNAQKLYDMLMRPIESELAAQKIETLVVVPDGILRTIPISALHDGKDFVISRYAFATTQGMQLTNTQSSSVNARSDVLIAGISESVMDFPALPNVTDEVREITRLYRTETLLNSDFSIAGLKQKIENRPHTMIHLATHGEFTGDISNMFILAWDGILDFEKLDKIIKVTRYKDSPLELLTLSACKTAAGDERAALGLAGIAVKAGAKSTLATLWEIDDKATAELVVEFYRELKKPGNTKSMALRSAQRKIMQSYGHPYFWSPFLLIGNWL